MIETTERRASVVTLVRTLAAAAISVAVAFAPRAAMAEDAVVTVEEVDGASDSREPIDEGFTALVDHEAWAALANGQLPRAKRLFERLVELRPNDVAAWRELGRVKAALGESAEAVAILRKVDDMQGHALDPELHFIVGQALIGMGKNDEGLAELEVAEKQLAAAEPSQQRSLWLARIHALRGDYRRAEAIYMKLLPDRPDAPEYESVSLSLAEAYLTARQWDLAEQRLRAFLQNRPGHERAQEMLAWALESRGKTEEELAVRGSLAGRMSVAPGRHAASRARALERAHEYPTALAEYRRAAVAGVDVRQEISRLEGYLAPEVGVGVAVFSDPMGDRVRSTAGVNVGISSRLRLAVVADYEAVSATNQTNYRGESARLVDGRFLGILGLGRGTEIAAGPEVWQYDESGAQVGGQALMRTASHRRWSLFALAEINVPWRDSAATLREGGTVDQAELQLYTTVWTDRLVLVASGRARRLALEMASTSTQVDANQLFGAIGADVKLSNGNGRVARGQLLDGQLVSAAPMASGIVASYRHYESRSDNPFGMRLSLVERSQLDELSLTARHVLDARGIISLAASSGVGFDQARELWRWRAGGLLYVSPSQHSRLSVSIDTASEAASGITGRNTSAMMGLHVDL